MNTDLCDFRRCAGEAEGAATRGKYGKHWRYGEFTARTGGAFGVFIRMEVCFDARLAAKAVSYFQIIMTKKLFSELGLSAELLKAIDKLGFEQASPVQSETIPVLL